MRLLHVEGSEAAAKSLADLARLQSDLNWQIFRVRDAFEAIDYLVGFKDFADRVRFPLPQIVVLSLSAGSTNGLDLLAWLRGEGRFRYLPVVVADAAGAKAEAVCAYELAPRAWFVQRAGGHEVLGLCECLVLNASLKICWPADDYKNLKKTKRKVLLSRADDSRKSAVQSLQSTSHGPTDCKFAY